ncbi:hypothetical protein BC940DRAFT_297858 [Gongronella butleri]|nr:hypothetical protein BC940DRAFT_297858 [Gongronella butleri]
MAIKPEISELLLDFHEKEYESSGDSEPLFYSYMAAAMMQNRTDWAQNATRSPSPPVRPRESGVSTNDAPLRRLCETVSSIQRSIKPENVHNDHFTNSTRSLSPAAPSIASYASNLSTATPTDTAQSPMLASPPSPPNTPQSPFISTEIDHVPHTNPLAEPGARRRRSNTSMEPVNGEQASKRPRNGTPSANDRAPGASWVKHAFSSPSPPVPSSNSNISMRRGRKKSNASRRSPTFQQDRQQNLFNPNDELPPYTELVFSYVGKDEMDLNSSPDKPNAIHEHATPPLNHTHLQIPSHLHEHPSDEQNDRLEDDTNDNHTRSRSNSCIVQ